MKIVKYLKSKEYHWTSFGQQKTLAGKFKRGLGQFTPHSFDDMKWAMMSGPTRLLQCLALCVMNLTCKVRIPPPPPARAPSLPRAPLPSRRMLRNNSTLARVLIL